MAADSPAALHSPGPAGVVVAGAADDGGAAVVAGACGLRGAGGARPRPGRGGGRLALRLAETAAMQAAGQPPRRPSTRLSPGVFSETSCHHLRGSPGRRQRCHVVPRQFDARIVMIRASSRGLLGAVGRLPACAAPEQCEPAEYQSGHAGRRGRPSCGHRRRCPSRTLPVPCGLPQLRRCRARADGGLGDGDGRGRRLQ